MRRLTLLFLLSGCGLLAACSVALGPIEACGNGVIEDGEFCDGANLGGETCVSLGHAGGTLACTSGCGFDVSGCTGGSVCGNGAIEGMEQCDGTNLGGATCVTRGYDGGTLACTGGCAFDVGGCTGSDPVCGNGVIEGAEQCDGANLDGETCMSLDYSGGTLVCTSGCAFNTSGCIEDGCNLQTVFFDSPTDSCSDGFQCSLNAEMNATCLPDSVFLGGSFYEACGANHECPFGSICSEFFPQEYTCFPICDMTNHPNCPGGGDCMYGVPESDLYFCDILDDCDPVKKTGCTNPEGCYIISGDGSTRCITAGAGTAGASCLHMWDCAPGFICSINGTDICRQMCDGTTACTSGTCNTIVGMPNGWGVCL